MSNHDEILIKLIRNCLTSKYEKYFDSLLQDSKHSDFVNWSSIKEEFYNHKRNFSDDLITDQELFEAMIDLIEDYFSKEIKLFIETPDVWNKFTEFCQNEKIRFEVIGTYEENEIPDAEINIVSTEYELSKFGRESN